MIGEIQIWSEIGQYKGIVNFIVCVYANYQFIQFTCSVVSDSLWPHESQRTMPPCPSPTPGVHSDSRPSSQSIYYFRPNSPFSSCSAIPGWTPQAFVLYNKYDIQYYPSREHRRKTTGGRGFSSWFLNAVFCFDSSYPTGQMGNYFVICSLQPYLLQGSLNHFPKCVPSWVFSFSSIVVCRVPLHLHSYSPVVALQLLILNFPFWITMWFLSPNWTRQI